jgi:hypothetical protein
MKKVLFDYSLRASVVKQERESFDIANFEEESMLNAIANGSLYIFFLPTEKYIILETGLLDYIQQLTNVIFTLSSGEKRTFAVSCDYYSNSLGFELVQVDILEITFKNEIRDPITCSFKEFKSSFERFKKLVYEEIVFYYPELYNNFLFLERKK